MAYAGQITYPNGDECDFELAYDEWATERYGNWQVNVTWVSVNGTEGGCKDSVHRGSDLGKALRELARCLGWHDVWANIS